MGEVPPAASAARCTRLPGPRPADVMRDTQVAAALVLGLFWCVAGIDPEEPQIERVLLLIGGAALLGVTLRGSRTAFLTGAYAVLIAFSERASREVIRDGSDVLRATDEALDVLLAGGNPYTHVMTSTNPPGSPFVYPPGEFLFY